MTTIIEELFLDGGAGLAPRDNHPSPTLTEALRQIADDFTAINVRQKAIQANLDLINVRQKAIQAAMDAGLGQYNAHRGAGGVHMAADVDNPIGSPVATDPVADILTILNEAVLDYEAHRILTAGGVHGAADATNVITATSPATTEAEAVLLVNDLKAMYEAHRILTAGGEHTNADTTNTIVAANATDWDSVVTLINEIKNTTGFNAHIILTTGPVHGLADGTNTITSPNAGIQITALYLETNEFQTDLNAHIAHLGVHPTAGVANVTAAATTEATVVALINGLKATINTHGTSTDDHLDADTTAVAGTATEYEDIIAVVAEWKAAYETHAAKSATHLAADAGNAGSVLGTAGEVAVLGTGAEVTIGLVKG